MDTTPVLFISHGSPMFALEPALLGPKLEAIGAQLTGVRAVLVVSAHWQTRGVQVASSTAPQTMHDFGGFPAELYRLHYPARGAPAFAAEAARLLAAAGFSVSLDAQRGLDHGAWVPLRYLYGEARMPVFQVSMPQDLDGSSALRLGAALAPLRQQGVLIVGSGSLTHNLGDYFHGATAAAPYASEFVAWIQARVQAGDSAALAQYRQLAPHAARAHPSEDHFLPLLVAMGASTEGDVPQLIVGGMDHGVLSMDSFVWGAPATLPEREPVVMHTSGRFAALLAVATLALVSVVATPAHGAGGELARYQAAEQLAKAHLARFDTLDFDVFTNQKWERLKESHAADIAVHWPDGHVTHGIDKHIEDLKAMFVYAPDTRILVHPVKVAQGEWTSVIGVMEGTFTKPMPIGAGKTIAPTGKAFRLTMCTVGHWKQGKMEEEYLFWDNQTFMKQIGLAP